MCHKLIVHFRKSLVAIASRDSSFSPRCHAVSQLSAQLHPTTLEELKRVQRYKSFILHLVELAGPIMLPSSWNNRSAEWWSHS